MISTYSFALNASFCAFNIAMYLKYQSPWSLAAAVFCGALAIAQVLRK